MDNNHKKFAFRHNPKSKKTKYILSLPVRNLCPKCCDIIEWRKKYRRYKPLTVPKKCTSCLQKNVRDAYHVICDNCVEKTGNCAKCMASITSADNCEHLSRDFLESKLKSIKLSERKRRSLLRMLDKELYDQVLSIIDEISSSLQEQTESDDFDSQTDYSEDDSVTQTHSGQHFCSTSIAT